MGKIISIIKKNLEVLIRNKFSLFILVFGPIIIIALLGFLFNNQNTYNINIGFYVPDNSSLSYIYIDNLKNSDFKLMEFKSEYACEDGIKKGINHICIFFPKDFELEKNESNSIMIVIDSSKKNIMPIAQNLLLDSLEGQSQVLQFNNTKTLVDIVRRSEEIAMQNKGLFENMSYNLEKLKQNNNQIESLLIQLNFSLRSDSFDIGDVSKKSDSVKSSVNDFVDFADDMINDTQSSLSEISYVLSGANFTGKTDVKNEVADIRTEVETLELKVNSLRSDYSLSTLSNEIGDLANGINLIMNKTEELISKLWQNNDVGTQKYNYMTGWLSMVNSTNTELLDSISKIKVRSSNNIVKPVDFEFNSVESQEDSSNHLSSLFPTLIVSLIFVIAIVLSSNFILMERESVAHFRNFLTKTNSFTFFFSNFLTLFMIIFVQLFMIVLIYYFVLRRVFSLDVFYLMLLLVPVIAVFVLIGVLIGYLSVNQATNVVLSFIVVFVLFAFSGLMLPLEVLSSKFVSLSMTNPYLISESLIRKFLIFGGGFYDFKFEVFALFVFILMFWGVGMILESIDKKRLVYQYYIVFDFKFQKWWGKVKEKFRKKFGKDGNNKKVES